MEIELEQFETDLNKAKITKQEFSDFSKTIIFFADLEEEDKLNTIHNLLELIQQKNDGCYKKIYTLFQNMKMQPYRLFDLELSYLLKFILLEYTKKTIILNYLNDNFMSNFNEDYLKIRSKLTLLYDTMNDDVLNDFMNFDIRFDLKITQNNIQNVDWIIMNECPCESDFYKLFQNYNRLLNIYQSFYHITQNTITNETNFLNAYLDKIEKSSTIFKKIYLSLLNKYTIGGANIQQIEQIEQTDDRKIIDKIFYSIVFTPWSYDDYVKIIKFKEPKIDTKKFKLILQLYNYETKILKNKKKLQIYIKKCDCIQNPQNPNFLEFIQIIKKLF